MSNDHIASIQYIIDHTEYQRIHVLVMMLNSPPMLIALSEQPEWLNERVTFSGDYQSNY